MLAAIIKPHGRVKARSPLEGEAWLIFIIFFIGTHGWQFELGTCTQVIILIHLFFLSHRQGKYMNGERNLKSFAVHAVMQYLQLPLPEK